jgi:7,8-dihydroneopterin aldolase/epimerase/oxygenase
MKGLDSDRIFIKNLVAQTQVGISAREKAEKQLVIIDLEFFCSLEEAGRSDNPKKTPSYSKIRDKITEFLSNSQFNLIEGVAEGIASLLLKSYPAAKKVRVRVRKEKYSTSPAIGIEITRIQDS